MPVGPVGPRRAGAGHRPQVGGERGSVARIDGEREDRAQRVRQLVGDAAARNPARASGARVEVARLGGSVTGVGHRRELPDGWSVASSYAAGQPVATGAGSSREPGVPSAAWSSQRAGPNGHVYIVSAARTPIGKFGGVLAGVPASSSGPPRSAQPSTARGSRRTPGSTRSSWARSSRPAPARRRPERRCSGRPCRHDPGDHDQPRLRLGPQGDHARGGIDQGRRRRRVRRGRHGVDERAPFLLRKARFGYRLGNGTLEDSRSSTGCGARVEDCHMGTHAERVAISDQVSREDQDAFAWKATSARSTRSTRAGSRPRWPRSPIRDAKGRETVVTVDEGPRRDTTPEALGEAGARVRAARRARTVARRRPAP